MILTVVLVLAVLALIVTVISAMGRAPIWIAVVLPLRAGAPARPAAQIRNPPCRI